MTAQGKLKSELTIQSYETPRGWEDWLAENHLSSDGIWLKIAKKESGIPTVTYAEALESALCYGWIDGQKAPFDNLYWLQKFTPRGQRSQWSQVNRGRAEGLIAAGRMHPAGIDQVEKAKADGRWERAYASQSQITIPDDFRTALDNNPRAADFFKTLNSANRYAVLYRIQTAKKPDTRQARIAKMIEMLLNEQKIHA